MKPKFKDVPLASLVEDFSIYPRHRVDDAHVSDLVRALEAGHDLPPIIVDAKTMRKVDGFHRSRAVAKHFGPEAMVKVELREYANEAALFMEAVALNSAHGRKLDRQDQTRIVLKMRELNIPDQQIAMTIRVPEPVVQTLSLRIVHAPAGPIPVKRGLEHMRGQTMTEEQVAVMESVRSAEAGRLALELIRLLKSGLVDLTDDGTVARLRELHSVVAEALDAVAA